MPKVMNDELAYKKYKAPPNTLHRVAAPLQSIAKSGEEATEDLVEEAVLAVEEEYPSFTTTTTKE